MQALGSNPFLRFTGEILRKSLYKDKEKKSGKIIQPFLKWTAFFSRILEPCCLFQGFMIFCAILVLAEGKTDDESVWQQSPSCKLFVQEMYHL